MTRADLSLYGFDNRNICRLTVKTSSQINWGNNFTSVYKVLLCDLFSYVADLLMHA